MTLEQLARLAATMTGLAYPEGQPLPQAMSMDAMPPGMLRYAQSKWGQPGHYNYSFDTSKPHALYYGDTAKGGYIIHTPDIPQAIMAHEMAHWLQQHAGMDHRSRIAERQANCVRDMFGVEGQEPGVCKDYAR